MIFAIISIIVFLYKINKGNLTKKLNLISEFYFKIFIASMVTYNFLKSNKEEEVKTVFYISLFFVVVFFISFIFKNIQLFKTNQKN